MDNHILAARAHLKPARSVSSSPESTISSNLKSASSLNNHLIDGKPSVKNLLRRFDANYGDPIPNTTTTTTTTIKSYEKKNHTSEGKSQIGIAVDTLNLQEPPSSTNISLNSSSLQNRIATNNKSCSSSLKSTATTPTSPNNINTLTPKTKHNVGLGLEDSQNNNCNTINAIQASKLPLKAFGSSSCLTNSALNFSVPHKTVLAELLPVDGKASKAGHESAPRLRRKSVPNLHLQSSDPKTFFSSHLLPPTCSPQRFTSSDLCNSKTHHNRNHSDFADTKVNTMTSLISQSYQDLRSSNSPSSSSSSSSLNSKLPTAKSRHTGSSPGSKKGSRNNSPTPRSYTSNHKESPQLSTRAKILADDTSISDNVCPVVDVSSSPSKLSPKYRSGKLHRNLSNQTSGRVESSHQRQDKQMKITTQINNDEIEKPETENSGLENVDFVARRETIHRAYTHRVKEDGQISNSENYLRSNVDDLAMTTKEAGATIQTNSLNLNQSATFDTSSNDTCNLDYKNQIDFYGIDSPTLGLPGSYIEDDDALSDNSNAPDSTSDTKFHPAHTKDISPSTHYLSSQDQFQYGERINHQQIMPGQFEYKNNSFDSKARHVSHKSMSGISKIEKYPSPPGAFQHDESYICNNTMFASSPQSPEQIIRTSKSNTDVDSVRYNASTKNLRSIVGDTKITVDNNHDIKAIVSDRFKNFIAGNQEACQVPADITDLETPVNEMYYETSDNGVIDSENRSAISSQDVFSKHSSWQSDYSIGIDHDYSGRNLSITDSNLPPSFKDNFLTPSPKSPKIVPEISPSSVMPSTAPSPPPSQILNSTHGPLLPPVATGECFTFTFPKNEPLNSRYESIQKWPLDYETSPPPLPNFQRSASSPSRRISPLNSTIRRPLSGIYSQNLDARSVCGDSLSQRASISSTYLNNFANTESFYGAKADFEAAMKDQLESEEEKNAKEEKRRRLYQRKMVIKELIDTEAVYFKDMNVVEEIYRGTAEACPNLESGDIKAIFRNTEEIVSFSNNLLEDLKIAALPIYNPRGRRSKICGPDYISPLSDHEKPFGELNIDDLEEQRDRETSIGASFGKHLSKMQVIYTNFLKNSESASSRLADLQKDPAVKVWLSECNNVAKDLTAAWDLDALLVKPVQRITRYQLLLKQIQVATPDTHPDSESLIICCNELSKLLKDIDDLKKRISMVAKIVGRKQKDSDTVRTGIVKAFGRRIEKTNISSTRLKEDEDYLKMFEKFGDDYLRLQVVLRDAEYYTRQVSIYVSDYLRYFSSIELIMRMSATAYPDIESKWAKFNVSMREMGSLFVEDHISEVRKFVIEPFEKTISAYNGPLLAIKKRDKRKIEFDKAVILKSQGKKIDEKLQNVSNEYLALHETLKWELPKLSQLTEAMGRVILGRFICIQVKWYSVWLNKVQSVLEENNFPKDIPEIIEQFKGNFKFEEGRLLELGIINGNFGSDPSFRRPISRSHSCKVSEVTGMSIRPLPDSNFPKRSSATVNGHRSQPGTKFSSSNLNVNTLSSSETINRGRPISPIEHFKLPMNDRCYTPEIGTRGNNDHNFPIRRDSRRESISTFGSYHDGPHLASRPHSGLFHSALPFGENRDRSQSRGSSRDRHNFRGYTVLYLAASLFEFNISATKKEAGYPYLTYQAGEIFDVIGEKGELWLAKNQDDSSDTVGWIWSKHFARLAAG